VSKNLKTVAGVDETYIAYGVYDLVAKVRAKSMGALKELISSRLRKIDKVRSTLTLILT
jgi:DNA-binding Lrp family transcriptional regulator